jgi:hypothetical protein
VRVSYVCTLLLLALSLSVAAAGPPAPAQCSVMPADALDGMVVCPDSPSPIPASTTTIIIRDAAGAPVANAQVQIQLAGGIRLCNTSVLTGVTDSAGRLVLTLRGGGCVANTPDAAVVTADGVVIRRYRNVKSPDFDGATADGVVSLFDFVRFVGGDLFHSYDNDGQICLSDVVIFFSAFEPGNSCTLLWSRDRTSNRPKVADPRLTP